MFVIGVSLSSYQQDVLNHTFITTLIFQCLFIHFVILFQYIPQFVRMVIPHFNLQNFSLFKGERKFNFQSSTDFFIQDLIEIEYVKMQYVVVNRDGRLISFSVGCFSMYTLVLPFLPILKGPLKLNVWNHQQMLCYVVFSCFYVEFFLNFREQKKVAGSTVRASQHIQLKNIVK
jgi:hypothetical protein